MSLSDYARELSCHASHHCIPLYQPSSMASILLVFKDLPVYLSIFLIFLQFYRAFRDIYYPVAVSTGIFLNTLINYGLRAIFRQGSPSTISCGNVWEMPTLSVQQGMFIVVMALTFPVLWRAHYGTRHVIGMVGFLWIVITGRLYLGYNSSNQIWFAALCGVVVGITWQLLVYRLLCYSNVEFRGGQLNLWARRLQYSNKWCSETLTGGSHDQSVRPIKIGFIWRLVLGFSALPAIVLPPVFPTWPSRRPARQWGPDGPLSPGMRIRHTPKNNKMRYV
jgi:hypothetical protein